MTLSARSFVSSFLGAIILLSSLGTAQPVAAATAAAAPDAPLETPDLIVANGVSDYFVASPKIFWSTHSFGCPPTLAAANSGDQASTPKSPDAPPYDEYVKRISIYGSEPRTLWQNITTVCSTSRVVLSNLVADANYIYWTTSTALVRLSTSANVGDAPETVTTDIKGGVELAIDSNGVYALKVTGNSPSYTAQFWTVNKTTNVATLLATRGPLAGRPNSLGSSVGSALVRGSADYLYWLESAQLKRMNISTKVVSTLETSVSSYFAEGATTFCLLISCSTFDYVFIGKGATLIRYNNIDSTSDGVIYTAPTNHTVDKINSDKSKLFLNLREELPCTPDPCFKTYIDHLYRRGRGSAGTTDLIYTPSSPTIFGGNYGLSSAGDYIFWQENDTILRLPKDAAALPKTNMKITGFSITQGIQKEDNSVILIKDRKTFVRLFVKSDGPPSVSGVTARLDRIDAIGNVLDTVMPANQPATNITVRTSPNRDLLNDSFLFELPWNWVSGGSLRLKARLNPYHSPVESSYADNDSTLGSFALNTSAALKVNFVSWGYTVNGKSYWPRFIKDIIQTYSWVSRAYPLASKIVFDGASGNTPGFHPNLWFQSDDSLGAKVMRTHDDCQDLLVKNPDGTTKSDNRSLCASRYTNYEMVAMRSENGLPGKRFFYGMISDEAKFPRGQACCGTAVSTGPTGDGDWGWDFDGSYADWYAAHEIGHTLGRPHPYAGSDNPATDDVTENCGHSRSDASFPYGNTSTARAPIGNGKTEGFDVGDSSMGIARAVYPNATWNDMMSYCDNQWISDYTYKKIYDFMKNSPPPLAMNVMSVNGPAVAGDFLLVNGTVISGSNNASLGQVIRKNNVDEIPALVAGGYALRLFNAGDTQLADYPFTPEVNEDGNEDLLTVNQVITMTAGASSLKLVRLSDNTALVTKTISANAPVVSNVNLPSAPNPVSGVVALNWTASDADGDALTFNIFYSPDGGTTLQPVASGVSGNSTNIDTGTLGGSANGLFRVVASDGVNTGAANSAAITMANKAPQPMIIDPSTGHTVQYGQLVNFNGAALDWQDGGVTGADLVWSTQDGVLGTGEFASSSALPVGSNVITLTATNSKGLSASVNVTVVVHDNLELAGPTMNVSQDQVSWQFGKDENLLSDQAIEVSNSGSGEINWTASTSAPWLTLSPITGTAPSTLTLTADAAQIPNGTSITATVVLTAPAVGDQPEQRITIQVGASKDLNAFTFQGGGAGFEVHLPLLIK